MGSVGFGVLKWFGGIASAIIISILTLYFGHFSDQWFAHSELVITTPSVIQGQDSFGTRADHATPCGGMRSNGCDFGTLTYTVNNQGAGNAKNCVLSLIEAYDAIANHDGGPILSSESGHHDIPIKSQQFDILAHGSFHDAINVNYPYRGQYVFSGKVQCDNGNADFPEQKISIK